MKLIKYCKRTNIGGYNIWQFVEIMHLARYQFGEILIWRNHSKVTRVTTDML